jgi:hypothetical protein
MPNLSPDLRWYWNGQAWLPVPPARDQAMWWTDAPDWAGPILLNGLILLIPVVGQMVVYGWLPAGFSYLNRGVGPFVAMLVWGLYYLAVLIVLGAALAVVITLASLQGGLWVAAAILVGIIATLVFIGAVIVMNAIAVPVLAVAADVGIGAAISPGYIREVARAYPAPVRHGLAISLIGNLVAMVVGTVLSCLLIAGTFVSAATLLSLAAPLVHVRVTPPAAP